MSVQEDLFADLNEALQVVRQDTGAEEANWSSINQLTQITAQPSIGARLAGRRSVSLVPLTPVRRGTGAARSGRLILCPNEAAHAISFAPKRSKKMTQPAPLDIGVKRREASSMQPPRRAIVLVASGVRGRQ